MSLLDRLIGTTTEKQERKGDRLLAAGRWGEAKLAYESALEKLGRGPAADSDRRQQLKAKIGKSRNALAREHRQSAYDLLEGGYRAEAREMLTLAIDVCADETLRQEFERQLQVFDADGQPETPNDQPVLSNAYQDQPTSVRPEVWDDDYFQVLCHTLPAPVRRAYRQYGEDFRQGYIALNRGDFETAARHLEKAHQDVPRPDSHIPLELATAYLNLGRPTEACQLLTDYRRRHPDILPAYQLLCEIYWDREEFTRATALLDSLPPDLAASLAAAVLRGETFERAGQLEAARDHYRRILDTYGWDLRMVHRLARVSKALNDTDEARQLYGQIMGCGHGCNTRISPRIRHEYAELCFEDGQRDVELLELYLALAREVPDHARRYFLRVADIYARQGHEHEARRFRELARQFRTVADGEGEENTP